MNIGKVSETILERSIFKQFTVKRDEVLIGPDIGADCSVIELGPDEVFVTSCDPITATANDIGALSVHITANDIASSGAEIIGLMLTVLLPEGFSEGDLKKIIRDINNECRALSIQILGGHTEVTKAVNQPIISATGVGKIKKSAVLKPENVTEGQSIVMTKWTGIEGTAIIAAAKEKELKKELNSEFIDRAIALKAHLSVVEESKIAMEVGASLMHDITEGGIFGALWEIGSYSNLGIEVNLDKIPIKQETVEICEYFDLNPYKLISSGSMVIITENGEELVSRLNEAGINGAIIGKTKSGNEKHIITSDAKRFLEPPKTDELYKVI